MSSQNLFAIRLRHNFFGSWVGVLWFSLGISEFDLSLSSNGYVVEICSIESKMTEAVPFLAVWSGRIIGELIPVTLSV